MEFITTDQRIAVENFYIGRIYTITFKNSSSITRACIGKGADYVMFQETAPKMLFTLNMQTAATVDTIEPGTGTGTYDYDDLENKPQINSVTLSGNKSSSDLGLQDAISSEDPLPASYVSGLSTVATSGAYSDLTGLPTLGTAAAADATDFATAAQGSKADAADTAISSAATGFASLDARLDSMDTTISGKQGALSSAQLDAVNSGIDSTKTAQIETNKTNILLDFKRNNINLSTVNGGVNVGGAGFIIDTTAIDMPAGKYYFCWKNTSTTVSSVVNCYTADNTRVVNENKANNAVEERLITVPQDCAKFAIYCTGINTITDFMIVPESAFTTGMSYHNPTPSAAQLYQMILALQ